jgi:hypothetical protein
MAKSNKAKADERAARLKGILTATTSGRGDGLLPDIPECVEAFPILNALMTVTEIDVKARKTATITFWVDDMGVKAVMSDRASNRKLWATSPSIMGVLGELEAALQAPEVDWRNSAGTKSKARS